MTVSELTARKEVESFDLDCDDDCDDEVEVECECEVEAVSASPMACRRRLSASGYIGISSLIADSL